MDNCLTEMIAFCKKYRAVVCYGASDHGYMTKHFLNKMGINVAFFIISGAVKEGECRDGVPVYSISKIEYMPNDYGIVLSLYERHHEEVLDKLGKHLKRVEGIYGLTMPVLRSVRSELLQLERDNEFRKKIVGDMNIYRKKISDIKKIYQKVLVQYIDVRRLGAYALWGYYLYKRKLEKNNIFYLYYPVTQEHRKEEYLKGSNGYLLTKLSSEGIEVLSEHNIDFWRCFFKNDKELFCFDNIYIEWGWKKELNEVNGNKEMFLPWISLSKEEIGYGNKSLIELEIDKKFICVSARDNIYLQSAKRDQLKEDFRDKYRNSDISKYEKALQYVKTKNMQSVRMGATVRKLKTTRIFIDYALNGRSEFLDVFLASRCKFFVSDLSGIFVLANMFGKNKVILNASLLTTKGDSVPFLHPEKDIAILKKLWDVKKKRFLTLREIFYVEVEMGNIEENIQGSIFGYYEKNSIIPVENTENDIYLVVKEMNERIDGVKIYDKIDIELQNRYRKIVEEYPKKENFLNNWRLGADFLRQNQWLLD